MQFERDVQKSPEEFKEADSVATTTFEFEGKSYKVPTAAAYEAKYTVLPDGTLVGLGWIESSPPKIRDVFKLDVAAMATVN